MIGKVILRLGVAALSLACFAACFSQRAVCWRLFGQYGLSAKCFYFAAGITMLWSAWQASGDPQEPR